MRSEPNFEQGVVNFFSGKLTLKEVEAIFAQMPYELDYVDQNDDYVWYSPNSWRDDQRLQKRLNHSVLGCHPERVQSLVKEILAALHTGEKDVVESPQVMGGHRVLIRYYAIRDPHEQYLGALQVTEDVERICELCEAHDFEHGIVDGKIIDGVSAASIHANRRQKGEQLADIQTPDKTQDAISGASAKQQQE